MTEKLVVLKMTSSLNLLGLAMVIPELLCEM